MKAGAPSPSPTIKRDRGGAKKSSGKEGGGGAGGAGPEHSNNKDSATSPSPSTALRIGQGYDPERLSVGEAEVVWNSTGERFDKAALEREWDQAFPNGPPVAFEWLLSHKPLARQRASLVSPDTDPLSLQEPKEGWFANELAKRFLIDPSVPVSPPSSSASLPASPSPLLSQSQSLPSSESSEMPLEEPNAGGEREAREAREPHAAEDGAGTEASAEVLEK